MIITPKTEPDKISYPLFAIDVLLFLFLGFVIFYGGPLFLFVLLNRKRGGRTEISDSESDIISTIYFERNGFTITWIILGFLFGIFFSIFMTLRKLNKSHLVSIEVTDNRMILGYLNTKGKESKKEIPLTANCLTFKFKKSTMESDPIIEIIDRRSGERILSTSKNKYWEYKYDFQKLLDLNAHLSKLNFVNSL